MADEAPRTQRVALLAGGSGLVGSELLRQLLMATDYSRVYAVSRRPLPFDNPRLANRIVPLEETRARLAGMRCDDAFCCIGSTRRSAGSVEEREKVDLDLVVSFARAAHSFGATQLIVISSAGANPQSRNAYLGVKGRLEVALRDLRFASLQIMRPGLLLGTRSDVRPLELVATLFMPLVNPLLLGAMAQYRGIAARDVAAAMLAAARAQRRGVNVYAGQALRALADSGLRPRT
ncbi:MAG: hypothetical protein ABI616_05885 [Pseudomonadota bacterium]